MAGSSNRAGNDEVFVMDDETDTSFAELGNTDSIPTGFRVNEMIRENDELRAQLVAAHKETAELREKSSGRLVPQELPSPEVWARLPLRPRPRRTRQRAARSA